MSDQDLAGKVRERANALVAAMNEAGEAGLYVRVKFNAYETHGDRTVSWYKPTVEVARKIEL